MNISELSLFFFAIVPCVFAVNTGGVHDVPFDDPEIIRLSQYSMVQLNEQKQGEPKYDLVEVVRATRQIVSGTMTRLTLRVSEKERTRLCDVEIWEQSWLNKIEVTFMECGEDPERDAQNKVSNQHDFRLQLFNDFLKKHNKEYINKNEYNKRFRIFRANLNKIKHLRKAEEGTAQYGLTFFSDMTAKEFQKYLGLKQPVRVENLPPADIPDIELPDEFDWRHYNVVTPIKDQKSCGSCWAFSVTGNVEGQWALKRGKLLALSEQELVDCDKLDQGCRGGYMTDAYKSIIQLGGLETESEYPYSAKDGTCHFNKTLAKVTITAAVNITSDEIKMAKWLVKNGPMSVALNANPMQFYFGGVSHPAKFLCNPTDLNHGVLIVGFGVHHSRILHRTLPFWIIKNSWGKHWGEAGYYRLYRGDGSCGVDQMVSSAIV